MSTAPAFTETEENTSRPDLKVVPPIQEDGEIVLTDQDLIPEETDETLTREDDNRLPKDETDLAEGLLDEKRIKIPPTPDEKNMAAGIFPEHRRRAA